MTDADLATALAESAGRALVRFRRETRLEGRSIGDAGDRLANEEILSVLRRDRPDDGILSEESADDLQRLRKERVWIIDPLDGTREYAEGRADWAVHVALAVGGEPAIGAVAIPAEGLLLRSDRPAGAPSRPERPRILVSRTRPPPQAADVATALDAELIPMGSAGVKAAAVVLGRGDIYLHAGGQYEWDNCAPAAVALGAGLHAARLDGAPLCYNNADPKVPDLLICLPHLAGRIREALGDQSA